MRNDPLWWYGAAACNGEDRDTFLRPANHHVQRRAITICISCPVRTVCLLHGIAMEEPWLRHGIFGGMTPEQRTSSGITVEEAEATWRVESLRVRERIGAT